MRSVVATVCLFLSTAAGVCAQGSEDAFGEKVRAYILANPEIILEAIDVLAAREAEAAQVDLLATSARAVLDPSRAVVMGDLEAPYRIFELFDYKCESCKAGHPITKAFVAENPDVVVMVQQLPILGPQSDRAARAYLAVFELAGAAAAAELHNVLFHMHTPISSAVLETVLSELGHDPDAVEAAMHSTAVSDRITKHKDAALALGAIGTPVFVTEQGMHQGIATPEVLEEMLAKLRAN